MTKTIKRVGITAVAAGLGVVGFAGTAQAESHVVQPGETLSGIAGSNWAAVAAANGIENPDLIYPGTVLELDGAAPSSAPAPEAPVEDEDEAPVEAEATEDQAPVEAEATGSEASGDTVWDRLAQCESSGDWSINTGNGYYGGLQFTQSSWEAAGGSGSPQDASREEQIRVAENLQDMQGWGAWPTCSAELGLR